MDTTAQPPIQTQSTVQSTQPVSTQVNSSDMIPQASSAPNPQVTSASVQQPLSGMHKEHAPIGNGLSEVMQSSEPALELHPEVKDIGVAITEHLPQLTAEQIQTGLSLAKESVSVSTQPFGFVKLPLSKEEVIHKVKVHTKIRESITWWLNMLLRQYKMREKKQGS